MGTLRFIGWAISGILTLALLASGGVLIVLIGLIVIGIVKLAIIGAIFFGIGGALLAGLISKPKKE